MVYVAGYMLVGLLDFCLLIWAVAEVQRARREKLAGRTITGTPTQLACWVKRATGVPVKAQNVKDWLRGFDFQQRRNQGKEYTSATWVNCLSAQKEEAEG